VLVKVVLEGRRWSRGCALAGWEQAEVFDADRDGGQLVVAGGGHGGDVGDDVGAVAGAGLGDVDEVSGPPGDLAPAGVAGGQVAGGDDVGGRRWPTVRLEVHRAGLNQLLARIRRHDRHALHPMAA